MTVKTMEPIGVAVSTSPPPRFSCEGEHVLRRPAEAIEGRDDEGVAVVQRAQRLVERRTGRASSGDAVIDVEVIAPDAGSEEVCGLSIRVLLTRRHPRVPDELPHDDQPVSQPTMNTGSQAAT
jgi:hypothetical protein